MAMLDMDFASKGSTCMSDDKSLDEGDKDVDSGIGVNITKRWAQAGLGEVAKMVVAPVWRNPATILAFST